LRRIDRECEGNRDWEAVVHIVGIVRGGRQEGGGGAEHGEQRRREIRPWWSERSTVSKPNALVTPQLLQLPRKGSPSDHPRQLLRFRACEIRFGSVRSTRSSARGKLSIYSAVPQRSVIWFTAVAFYSGGCCTCHKTSKKGWIYSIRACVPSPRPAEKLNDPQSSQRCMQLAKFPRVSEV